MDAMSKQQADEAALAAVGRKLEALRYERRQAERKLQDMEDAYGKAKLERVALLGSMETVRKNAEKQAGTFANSRVLARLCAFMSGEAANANAQQDTDLQELLGRMRSEKQEMVEYLAELDRQIGVLESQKGQLTRALQAMEEGV